MPNSDIAGGKPKMVNSWLMVDKPEQPREECHLQPKVFVSLEELKSIGVLYFKVLLATSLHAWFQ